MNEMKNEMVNTVKDKCGQIKEALDSDFVKFAQNFRDAEFNPCIKAKVDAKIDIYKNLKQDELLDSFEVHTEKNATVLSLVAAATAATATAKLAKKSIIRWFK